MQKYELMILIWSNDHTESTAKETIKTIKSEIEAEWWKVFYEDYWGRRPIAYKIKHNEEGYYQIFNFEFEKEKLSTFEKSLNLNKAIIRLLITKIDDDYKPFTKVELDEAERIRHKELKDKKFKKRTPDSNRSPSRWEVWASKSRAGSTDEVKKVEPKIAIKDLDTKIDDIVKDI